MSRKRKIKTVRKTFKEVILGAKCGTDIYRIVVGNLPGQIRVYKNGKLLKNLTKIVLRQDKQDRPILELEYEIPSQRSDVNAK